MKGSGVAIARETSQFLSNPRIFSTPLPLHPLAPRTFDPSGCCIAPRARGPMRPSSVAGKRNERALCSLRYSLEVSARHAKISLQNGRATGPLAPCFPTNSLAELNRTGRGDEGEWGRDCSKTSQFLSNPRIFGTPLPLHPLAPRTFDPSGCCIAPREARGPMRPSSIAGERNERAL